MTDRTRGLGGYIAERRRLLGLSQSRAATLAGASRTSWVAWEKGTATPEDYSHIKIEHALGWEPGSVAAIVAGRKPTPLPEPEPEPEPVTPVGRLLLQLYDLLIADNYTHAEADAVIEAEIARIQRKHREQERDSTARGTDTRAIG